MIGLGILIIACILFDFAAQACFNPCESLIYDTCKGTSQESSCFFVYSFMTSFGTLKKQTNKSYNIYLILFFLNFKGGCLGYLITATDWTETFLSDYMQGQEKLTFIVILLFFSITLCCTLISANEKVSLNIDNLDDQPLSTDVRSFDYLFPIEFFKSTYSSVSNSVRTIITMPSVLRRLTLAECCSWFDKKKTNRFVYIEFCFLL